MSELSWLNDWIKEIAMIVKTEAGFGAFILFVWNVNTQFENWKLKKEVKSLNEKILNMGVSAAVLHEASNSLIGKISDALFIIADKVSGKNRYRSKLEKKNEPKSLKELGND